MSEKGIGGGRPSFARRAEEFGQRLAEARSRSDADGVLARMLEDPAIDMFFREDLAESLSRTCGEEGSKALRKQFAVALEQSSKEPNKRRLQEEYEFISACAGSLFARESDKATDVYIALVEYPNASLCEYRMTLLAWAGDDSAWEKVYDRLTAMLRRPMSRDGHRWSSVFWAIEYLTRHASAGSGQATRVITLVRANWCRVADPEALEKHWPGLGPDGPAPESITFPQPSLSEVTRLSAAQARPDTTDQEWHPELAHLMDDT